MCKRKYVAAVGKVYEENSEMVVLYSFAYNKPIQANFKLVQNINRTLSEDSE